MGRIEHSHNKTSVIILVIDQYGIITLKLKSQTPIAADIYRPMPRKLTSQRMETPARSINVLRLHRIIEGKKLPSQLIGVFRLNAGLRTIFKGLLNSTVSVGCAYLFYLITTLYS